MGGALQAVCSWMRWRDGETTPLPPLPEDQLQFGWLCCVSLCSQEILLSRAKRGSSSLISFTSRWEGGDSSPRIQHLLVHVTDLLQSSCVLDGSTSLWPNGSASVLHLLAGRSCAAAAASVSLWSSEGSREPFWSWLGTLGWLQPLELSETGAGASANGWEGPLD